MPVLISVICDTLVGVEDSENLLPDLILVDKKGE